MSSSKKRRPHIQQCNGCRCFFLQKDYEMHRIGDGQHHGTRDSRECFSTDFRDSSFQMVEPGRGLSLREQKMGTQELGDCFPFELCGWTRRHMAIVNPETLTVAGIQPRSAVSWLMGEDRRSELLILWPSSDVQPLRIVLLSASMKIENFDTTNCKLIKLAILHCFPLPVTSITVRPRIEASKMTKEQWVQLSELSHFHLFLRSYFANAFVSAEFDEMELLYYGHSLCFGVVDAEYGKCALNTDTNADGQSEAAKAKRQGAEDLVERDTNEQTKCGSSGTALRILPTCLFAIDWKSVVDLIRSGRDELEGLR